MSGGQRVGAELPCGRQQIGELHGLVAGDAGDGRFPRDVAFRERIDHRLAEPLLVIEDVMGNAERLGDAAGIGDVLPGAAGAGPVGRRAMVIKLQRHADDVVALTVQEPGDDG